MDYLSRTNNSFTETRFEYDPKAEQKLSTNQKPSSQNPQNLHWTIQQSSRQTQLLPYKFASSDIIDLGGMDGGDRRDEIVDEMCRASEEWWNTFRSVEWIVNLTNKIRRRRKSSTCVIGIEK
ncbi:hypothetical protein ACSBR1_031523 [Camellia fascicularis]